MRKRYSKEVLDLAATVAERISRFRKRDDIFAEHAAHEIAEVLELNDDFLANVMAKATPDFLKSGFGYGVGERQAQRMRNIRTERGFGRGCNICHGSLDTETFMTLRIGWHQVQVLIDFCEPCARRLLERVEARFEDAYRRSA